MSKKTTKDRAAKAPYVPTTKRIDAARVHSNESINAHKGTRLVGYCMKCRQYVEVGDSLSCGKGHGRDELAVLYERPDDLPIWHFPAINIGAACVPPVWGTAHGQFWPLVYYPLWFACETLVYSSVKGTMPVYAGVAAVAVTVAAHVAYGIFAAPKGYAYKASVDTPDHYLENERKWALGMAALLVAIVAFIICYDTFFRGR